MAIGSALASRVASRVTDNAARTQFAHFLENPARETVAEKADLAFDGFMTETQKVPLLKRIFLKAWGLIGRLAQPKPTDLPLRNMGELTPDLLRGAQPTAAGFAELKAQGVKTIVNLQAETQWEKPVVEGLGLHYAPVPLEAAVYLQNSDFVKFLRTVSDPANGKVFFHCTLGKDRTGAMAAAYRIAAQNWKTNDAVAEMFQHNYHPGIEDSMAASVRRFATYWKRLPATLKDEVLHRTPPKAPGLSLTA